MKHTPRDDVSFFEPIFFETRTAHSTKIVALERYHRYLPIDTSLRVYTVRIVEKPASKFVPGVCYAELVLTRTQLLVNDQYGSKYNTILTSTRQCKRLLYLGPEWYTAGQRTEDVVNLHTDVSHLHFSIVVISCPGWCSITVVCTEQARDKRLSPPYTGEPH